MSHLRIQGDPYSVENNINIMMSMGYSHKDSMDALIDCSNDISAAVSRLNNTPSTSNIDAAVMKETPLIDLEDNSPSSKLEDITTVDKDLIEEMEKQRLRKIADEQGALQREENDRLWRDKMRAEREAMEQRLKFLSAQDELTNTRRREQENAEMRIRQFNSDQDDLYTRAQYQSTELRYDPGVSSNAAAPSNEKSSSFAPEMADEAPPPYFPAADVDIPAFQSTNVSIAGKCSENDPPPPAYTSSEAMRLSGPYLSSSSKAPNCAACFNCICRDEGFSGMACTVSARQIYHMECWERRVALKCHYCKDYIGVANPEKNFSGKSFTYESNNYHEECYRNYAGPRCSSCFDVIVKTEQFCGAQRERNGMMYHLECHDARFNKP